MVFQKEIENKRLIVLADSKGQNQKVISDSTKDTYHPEISSSGRYVAYSEGVIAPPNTLIQVVIQDLQTKTKEIWTDLDNQFIHSEFSGNEKFLVYSGPNPKTNKQNIHIIDLHQERLQRPSKTVKITSAKDLAYTTIETYKPSPKVIESDYDCYAPAVSSDGSLIIYHRTEDKTISAHLNNLSFTTHKPYKSSQSQMLINTPCFLQFQVMTDMWLMSVKMGASGIFTPMIFGLKLKSN